jgi:phosphatidate cytidylyltransferase
LATNLKRIFFGSIIILLILFSFLLGFEEYLFFFILCLVIYEIFISGIIKTKIILHFFIILICLILIFYFEFNIIYLIIFLSLLLILSFFFDVIINPSFTFFLCLFLLSLFKLYYIDIHFVYLIIFISFLNDTTAYICGKSLKGPLILPFVSPNKTWSGTSISFLFSSIFLIYLDYNIALSLLLSSSLFIGDIYFSFIKRKNNLKDFSNLIPGHGGILDRLDSMTFFSLILLVRNLL